MVTSYQSIAKKQSKDKKFYRNGGIHSSFFSSETPDVMNSVAVGNAVEEGLTNVMIEWE